MVATGNERHALSGSKMRPASGNPADEGVGPGGNRWSEIALRLPLHQAISTALRSTPAPG
jgi:hypothetical protein